MDVRDLEVFLSVAKHLNFTRAGEEGIEVKMGQVVTFGTLACELVSSGDLYDAL